MRIRIESDGTPAGTNVYDENGRPLSNVLEIRWQCRVGDPMAKAVLTVMKMPVDLTADATVVEVAP